MTIFNKRAISSLERRLAVEEEKYRAAADAYDRLYHLGRKHGIELSIEKVRGCEMEEIAEELESTTP